MRFYVQIDDAWIGASIRKETLHYAYRPNGQDEDPLETYRSHMLELDAAVCRRVANGAREPVMLRDADLVAV